jgi:hypothetical protein
MKRNRPSVVYPAHQGTVPAAEIGTGQTIFKGDDMRSHGAAEIRGINCPRSYYYDQGRFGRLFPLLYPFRPDAGALRTLGEPGGLMDPRDMPGPMDNPRNPNNPAGLPAGFTFLGQFLDHDITFDPTSSLERQSDPEAIRNYRTPVLELDSVYGAGPGANPHLYQKGDRDKLLLGLDTAGYPYDLPRNSEDVALIGDPRNDENLIISQLHVAFLKFHNAVVDTLPRGGLAGRTRFEEAQRLVRWHYQWMIVHEYLPHIVGQALVDDILAKGRRLYDWRNQPFIPVEFSVAAFRFGHSQVRPGYTINTQFARGLFSSQPSVPPNPPNDLSGGRRLLPVQVIDWRCFFKLSDQFVPQIGKAIDTRLSTPLFALPTFSGTPGDPQSLAQRTLLRHLTFGLSSGQAAALAMEEDPLTPGELSELKGLGLDRETPLWYYILAEAEKREKGVRLGPVGGRIVAEVFLGLLYGDRMSYMRENVRWKPTLGSDGDFKMADLLRIAGVA